MVQELPQAAPQAEKPKQKVEMSREMLGRMRNIEVEVKADFSATIEALKAKTGAALQPRPEGFHITVISVTEAGILEKLTDEQIEELKEINEEIKTNKDKAVTVLGIGYIDGANSGLPMREADLTKKTAFLTLDIPRLQAFRTKIGLPAKDFHVTLGFEGGDIQMQIIGQEEFEPGKFKNVTGPIPKKADPNFSDIVSALPELKFGGLAGDLKTEKQAKPVQEQKPKREDPGIAVFGKKTAEYLTQDRGVVPGPAMGKAIGLVNGLMAKNGGLEATALKKLIDETPL